MKNNQQEILVRLAKLEKTIETSLYNHSWSDHAGRSEGLYHFLNAIIFFSGFVKDRRIDW